MTGYDKFLLRFCLVYIAVVATLIAMKLGIPWL